MVKTVAIVSLSSGVLGEAFIAHELKIGLDRLRSYNLNVKFMKNALRGNEFLNAHPEARAADLLQAFQDDEIDMIFCAIGGDDTYRLLPYLFGNNELRNAVTNKIFLGFSDTTINHFMLHNVGLNTFYGQSFLSDVCDIGKEMLPYSKKYFEKLITTGTIDEICPSDIWYDGRTNYGASEVGTDMPSHKNYGFELLQGQSRFSGKILGGCIDSIYDIFNTERYADTVAVCKKYGLFPTLDDWKGRILLLETSEEKPTPEKYRKMLTELKNAGIFGAISGIVAGKPMDEQYADDYKKIIVEVVDNPALPIVWNINIGHATPRCIIPFGVLATVDTDKQKISFAQ